nr:MAG TPA: hypothetical protein [Caudoviricetes sp.]
MEKKKGYKGFKKGLICDPTDKNPFQYAENTTFEESDAKICNCGLHFCENPFDVLDYYGFVGNDGTLNEFAEVEALDECLTDDNKKFVTKKLHIGARLSIAGLVQAFVNFTFGRVDWKNDAATNTGYRSAATNTGYWSAATNTGDQSAATNTGDQSAATNTGYQSAATNTGNQSAATNTGDQSAATNTGYRSAATNTGNQSAATNTGNQSAATNTGYQSAATNTGYRSAATNTGYRSAAAVEGRESFAIATGIEGMAKGSLGCYIAVAEYEETEDGYRLVDFKSHIVDGETIKADTFYMLKNGEFMEVE